MQKNLFEAEYHSLSLCYFVSFIAGIIFYFSLNYEPSMKYIIGVFFGSIGLLFLRRYGLLCQFVSCLVVAFAFGMLVSKYRVSTLKSISLDQTIISQITGTVESIKPTVSGNQMVLRNVNVAKLNITLPKVRITIPNKYLLEKDVSLLDEITLLVKMYSPQSSIIPGGYNFEFYSYLADISASGYAMSDITVLSQDKKSSFKKLLQHIRKTIYTKLVNGMGSENGNFAAAILLGETKGIDKNVMNAMRMSGISHILCVSGLHLSLVAGILFVSMRVLLNLSDYLAFNLNIKVIAACFSLIGSYIYLELSGMQIAATRAFIMTAIFILSIILDRKIYPLRSIAIAAFCILCFNPEYVFHPSFQLSFVAVLSLIVGFEFYTKHKWILGGASGIFGSIKIYILSNIYSSFLASIITAPVVINQFYIFSNYSIPMNLIAVPIMSFFLMPLGIISLILMPINLESSILHGLSFFIEIISRSAIYANNLPYSVWYFGYVTPLSILLFIFGFFWICIWQTRIRLWGIVIILISFVLMSNSPKPDLIFDSYFGTVGLKTNKNVLEIYSKGAKMPKFNRTYWANWFGQKDAEVFELTSALFRTATGKTISINYNQNDCNTNVDVNLNMQRYLKCTTGINVDYDLLKRARTILVFCGDNDCSIKYEINSRFGFN